MLLKFWDIYGLKYPILLSFWNSYLMKYTSFSKQEEDSAEVSDFVSNLRSALRSEISALIDMEEAQQGYPAYSINHKRRFVPQQLMGWKPRGNTAIDSSHGLKRKQRIKKFSYTPIPPLKQTNKQTNKKFSSRKSQIFDMRCQKKKDPVRVYHG